MWIKAQVSAEFLFVLAALALLFLIIYSIYLGERINLYQAQDTLAGMRNAYAVSAALNYVHLAGDGAQYDFTLAGVSQSEDITLSGATVQSNRTYSISQSPLLNGNVNTSEVERGTMRIRNNGGAIEIE